MSMISLQKERRLLQVAVAIACLVPICAGLNGAVIGPEFLGSQAEYSSISSDSHFRYLSGLLLGIGLAFFRSIGDIENQTKRFRLLTSIVFVGGLARLCGVFTQGIPDAQMQLALVMELIITPLLCFWQNRFARRWLSR